MSTKQPQSKKRDGRHRHRAEVELVTVRALRQKLDRQVTPTGTVETRQVHDIADTEYTIHQISSALERLVELDVSQLGFSLVVEPRVSDDRHRKRYRVTETKP